MRLIVVAALLVPLFVAAQGDPQADAKRFAEIKAKHDQNQPISDADRQWAQRYMAAHPNLRPGAQKGGAQPQNAQWAEWAKAHPPRDFTGLVPLADLGKGQYQGEQGGLYPGGENTVPAAHLKAGLALAKSIVPLDAEGRKSADGKIVFMAIGMSNTTMEFVVFQELAAKEKGLNPRLALVDGAQNGQTPEKMADPSANYWRVVDARMEKAGVAAKQVQAVWYKQANAMPKEGFPGAARKLQEGHIAVMHDLHDKFPNLKIVYMSDRTYGGYALMPLNPEPYAYETGFSVKWTIGDQINGKPELNFDPSKGAVRSPWLAWGPSLWTDGVKGRKTDSLVWLKEDCRANDRTHPSEESGRKKVAELLMDFLKKDPTSRPWFLAKQHSYED